MAVVQWIKITTSIFDDEKIKLIDAMPDCDAIFVIWIRLLTLAGKINDRGDIYLCETIPYTDEMLSTIFNRQVSTVRLALEVFTRFKMIEILDNKRIHIVNWEKHQNIEGLEKIKLQSGERVRRFREKKSLEACNVTVTQGNATEENRLEENKSIPALSIEKKSPQDSEKEKEILTYLNERSGKNFKHVHTNYKPILARFQEGFSLENFKEVIDSKVSEWGDDSKMSTYIRPQTLFGTQFESYLQASCTVMDKGDSKKRVCIKCEAQIPGTMTCCPDCGEPS